MPAKEALAPNLEELLAKLAAEATVAETLLSTQEEPTTPAPPPIAEQATSSAAGNEGPKVPLAPAQQEQTEKQETGTSPLPAGSTTPLAEENVKPTASPATMTEVHTKPNPQQQQPPMASQQLPPPTAPAEEAKRKGREKRSLSRGAGEGGRPAPQLVKKDQAYYRRSNRPDCSAKYMVARLAQPHPNLGSVVRAKFVGVKHFCPSPNEHRDFWPWEKLVEIWAKFDQVWLIFGKFWQTVPNVVYFGQF